MSPDQLEKVLQKLASTDRTTLVVSNESDGKMRLTLGSWERERDFSRGQAFQVCNVGRPGGPVVSDDDLSKRNRLLTGDRSQSVINYLLPARGMP